MTRPLKEIEEDNIKDPIVEVVFVKESGRKVSISINAYHESLERMFQEAIDKL